MAFPSFSRWSQLSLFLSCFTVTHTGRDVRLLTCLFTYLRLFVYTYLFFVVQFLSRACPFVTPWAATHQSLLSFTISQSLLKLMSLESVMLSNHLILCHPLLLPPLIFLSIRVFAMSLLFASSSIGASASAQPSQWLFRVDILYYRLVWSPCSPGDSQASSSTPQFKSISSSVLGLLYGPTLTSVRDYWKNHSFYCTDLCPQSDVSAFTTPSRFVIAFLPRSKCPLISWLQSSSAVIWEPKERKYVTVSTFPCFICHEVILIFWMLSIKPVVFSPLPHHHQEVL